MERPDVRFLSELYAQDVPDAVLLAEYPSSNSQQTQFQNCARFIIHDPYPPPRRELLKILGPHHLMCAWGHSIPVSSEIAPPSVLVDHWERVVGADIRPVWQPYRDSDAYVTLFPHESVPADRQVVDPAVNYELHSKAAIAKIDCPQAQILDRATPPCIVKLSHGYAGLGNFLLREENDVASMCRRLEKHWPEAELIVNSVVENVVGDYGVQFYLRGDGSMIWLGATQQHFDEDARWCGGAYSADLQERLRDDTSAIVLATGEYLHRRGYLGLVGVDVLKDSGDKLFLVDVNPRLTGISPFLMLSRIFQTDGLTEGIYQASVEFNGTLDQLMSIAEEVDDSRLVVLSAFEDVQNSVTVCHLAASSTSMARCRDVLDCIQTP